VGEGRAETEEREGALSNRSLNTNVLLICLTILSTLYGNTIRSPSLVGEAEVESLAPVVLCSGKVCECQESNSVAGSSASSAKSEQKTHIRACLPSKERPISSPFAHCAICSRSPLQDLFVEAGGQFGPAIASRTTALTNYDEVESSDSEEDRVSLLVARSVARLVDCDVLGESA
jgi:hypothetical protein